MPRLINQVSFQEVSGRCPRVCRVFQGFLYLPGLPCEKEAGHERRSLSDCLSTTKLATPPPRATHTQTVYFPVHLISTSSDHRRVFFFVSHVRLWNGCGVQFRSPETCICFCRRSWSWNGSRAEDFFWRSGDPRSVPMLLLSLSLLSFLLLLLLLCCRYCRWCCRRCLCCCQCRCSLV